MDLLIIYYTTVSAVSYSRKCPIMRNARVCDYVPLSQSINYRALKSDIGTACASYTAQTKQRMHAENTNYHQQL